MNRIQAAAAEMNMTLEDAAAFIAKIDALTDESDADREEARAAADTAGTTREELSGCLRQCAAHCVDRASEKQIKRLVDLIFAAGRQNEVWGGMKLTSRAASRMIEEIEGGTDFEVISE